MTPNKKAAAGRQAALVTAKHTSDNTRAGDQKQALKRLIITLALWGLLPAAIATWLIQRGGLRHE